MTTRYAQIVDGVVHLVTESETQPDSQYGVWIACGNAGPGWTYNGTSFAAPVPPAPTVPTVLTMRQARLVLFTAGLIGSVQAAINALPSPDKEKAQIEWDFSNEVQRHNGFVSQLAPALGLTSEQVDALFVTGAAL